MLKIECIWHGDSCLQGLGTKGLCHPLSTLQNNEPLPQVLKQVVNLSCLICKHDVQQVLPFCSACIFKKTWILLQNQNLLYYFIFSLKAEQELIISLLPENHWKQNLIKTSFPITLNAIQYFNWKFSFIQEIEKKTFAEVSRIILKLWINFEQNSSMVRTQIWLNISSNKCCWFELSQVK